MSEKLASEHITLYEPDEMIVICRPEITLVELDEMLAKNGQWIATLLPQESDELTLGDALMRNAYHPRARFGSPLATSVLGGTFETFSGKQFRSGSRVVKSVAGYDTHRAYVGSEGKLFKALELTLKVMPRPKMFIRVMTTIESKKALLMRRPLILEDHDGGLIVEFAGQVEDMLAEREWLSANNITMNEIDEWPDLIRTISRERTASMISKPIDAKAIELLTQLTERINA
jgi:FAD/FMN-containing dehydrogenase